MKVIIALAIIIGITLAKQQNHTKTYHLFKLTKVNWYGAFLHCQSRDMQLATINSAEEQLQLETTLRDAGMQKDWFWVSGTDLSEEGNFAWMSTGKSITYKKWSSGQPDNYKGNEHCINIWNRPENDIRWNDAPCATLLYIICEDKSEPVLKFNINVNVE